MLKKTTRLQKILAVMLSLFMIVTVCPLTAFAADGGDVTYMDRTWDSESETVLSEETTLAEPLRSFPGQLAGGGWYYTDEDLTCNDRVTVPAGAAVNLILADDVTLTCKNGIYVAATATLNIYGQSEDRGLLKATGSTDPADPGTPSGDNICKWDNVDHGTSFWGRLIKFFHSVLYFFAHLFGRR